MWDRLGKAAALDIESNDFSWDSLLSLHHTKHTSSADNFEDELNKALEVCCCCPNFYGYDDVLTII